MTIEKTSSRVAAIVLAAGKGTRMKSQTPKVLHRVCGTPMLTRIMRTLAKVKIDEYCLVVGGNTQDYDGIRDSFPSLCTVKQNQRRGTADAVASSAKAFKDQWAPYYTNADIHSGNLLSSSHMLICAGDTPALDGKILGDFVSTAQNRKVRLALIGMSHPEPFGYGRLVCDENGQLMKIVEEKDANPEEKTIQLVNTGVIFAERQYLFYLLDKIDCQNAQSEYYLTDCFSVAAKEKEPIFVYKTDDYDSFEGVNSRSQLVNLEEKLLARRCQELAQKGVTIHKPSSAYIEDSVEIGADTEIGSHCSFIGQTIIGEGCQIGSNCVFENIIIDPGTSIASGSVLTRSR